MALTAALAARGWAVAVEGQQLLEEEKEVPEVPSEVKVECQMCDLE